MSAAISTTPGKLYGIQRVCNAWEEPRFSFYGSKERIARPAVTRKRGPKPLLSDDEIECSGKIRLGHAIFIEEEHKRIFRKHQLPIAICPSCHRYIGCWRQGQKHPVQKIYPYKESPIAIGTHDSLIFSTSFKRDMELARNGLPYDRGKYCNYRFGQSKMS